MQKTILLVLLLACGNVQAETLDLAVVERALNGIDIHSEDLSKSGNDVATIHWKFQHDTQDYDAAETLLKLKAALAGWIANAQATGRLATQMRSADDARVAMQEFNQAARSLNWFAGQCAFEASQQLSGITDPLLLTNARKVRDSMIALRDDTMPFLVERARGVR
jgi:hypothetical protein